MLLNAVNGGRSSLERVVQLVAETPAQLYRLWPRKGNLQPGADADIVLVDMKGKQILSNDAMLSRSAWTPYDGVKVQGFPVATYVRGQLVASEGKVVAKPGTGRFLPGPGFEERKG
jgi:dihydroorotase-like cyclic amidohydrolase